MIDTTYVDCIHWLTQPVEQEIENTQLRHKVEALEHERNLLKEAVTQQAEELARLRADLDAEKAKRITRPELAPPRNLKHVVYRVPHQTAKCTDGHLHTGTMITLIEEEQNGKPRTVEGDTIFGLAEGMSYEEAVASGGVAAAELDQLAIKEATIAGGQRYAREQERIITLRRTHS